MTSRAHFILSLFLLYTVISFVGFTPSPANSRSAPQEVQLTDSLYNENHPRLLFTDAEIPALYDKVRDGGYDDDAYNFIRLVADYIYPGQDEIALMDKDYGFKTIPNLGMAGFLEIPKDTASLAIGRHLTIYIADNYGVDDNDFDSSLRLRALVLGYDMFFENSPESTRNYIRNEIVSYIDTMITDEDFIVFKYRPYLSNRTTMIASSLGLAAICLAEEIDSARVATAFDLAGYMIDKWLLYLVDPEGAYNEGVLYGAWSMRNLAYYFYARKRYDGYDYSSIARLRNLERWFVYELLPEGDGRTNNLNDCGWNDFVLSRHSTYADWAQTVWGSNLSAWLWEHTAGPYGSDWGLEADKVGTVIWNQGLSPEEPQNLLPKSFLWKNRGLYYYRSGWELDPASNDVVFSFYSGKFHGGHAQEDQGQFTLYGYGAKFAIDHGPGSVAKQSEAHNIVFIDDLGQHNAGSSIGTDGKIEEYLLSTYADYLVSDLTSAYNTYSPLNCHGYPFPFSDWSWGYDGGNPVNHAFRTVITVHDSLPPYFIIFDDIEKDSLLHEYEWRMHTHDANSVNTSTNPIQITRGTSSLDLYVINPPFDSVQTNVTPFNNLSSEPDALAISLSVTDTNPHFALLLFPKDDSVPTPVVNWETYAWGFSLTVDWGGDVMDVFIRNTVGDTITYSFDSLAGRHPEFGAIKDFVAGTATICSMTTDASLTLTRIESTRMTKYLLKDVSEFTYNDTTYVSVSNGPLSCALSGNVIQVDRYDADFLFYAPGVSEVFYRTQNIYVVIEDGYLTPDPVIGVGESPQPDQLYIKAKAFPNPFNPSTTVLIELPERATANARIYDPYGRLVRDLWRGPLPKGLSTIRWDGTNNYGIRVSSGVYFLKIQSLGTAKTLKLVIVK